MNGLEAMFTPIEAPVIAPAMPAGALSAAATDSGEFADPTTATVLLSTGRTQCLAALDVEDLIRLQWREECAFARQIANAPRGSQVRADAMRVGYDTICTILAARDQLERGADGETFGMGFDQRYTRLVLKLLKRYARHGARPRLFEVGYGAGALLKPINAAGYEVGGIEVSPAMRRAAIAELGGHADALRVGDFLTTDLAALAGQCHVVYWNDVWEHIPTDEILDYVKKIHSLLVPGGKLVTITPNWHHRPSDVTKLYLPPRSEAVGFHLKEYTLREISEILREAGFARVGTPLFVLRRNIHLAGDGLAALKRFAEPALEWLPFKLAKTLCRGFGLSCTIATKAK